MSPEEVVCQVKKIPLRDVAAPLAVSHYVPYQICSASRSNCLGTSEPSSAQNLQTFSTKAKEPQKSVAMGKIMGHQACAYSKENSSMLLPKCRF